MYSRTLFSKSCSGLGIKLFSSFVLLLSSVMFRAISQSLARVTPLVVASVRVSRPAVRHFAALQSVAPLRRVDTARITFARGMAVESMLFECYL